jgi:small subunit ribosomal protein S11
MASRNTPTRQELQQTASARARKKVKKNVAEGIAHVHASFNNTIITITDRQGNTATRCPGRPPATPASRARASPRRSRRRSPPSARAARRRNAA